MVDTTRTIKKADYLIQREKGVLDVDCYLSTIVARLPIKSFRSNPLRSDLDTFRLYVFPGDQEVNMICIDQPMATSSIQC
jgi:hypothetical protein